MRITQDIWSSLLRRERRSFLLVFLTLTLASFALSSMARAVTPAPDGGYPYGNTAEGDGALQSITSGISNTAIGYVALTSTTAGIDNTAVGAYALFQNRASYNTALGLGALQSNTDGFYNTASGLVALLYNSTGSNNVASGYQSLYYNTTGSSNTATGVGALKNNNANANTASGAFALFSNTIGIQNTATGFNALVSNTTGNHNTANGFKALEGDTTGNNNTATGQGALNQLTTGSFNTADGQAALNRINTGSSNIALGFNAGSTLTTGGNNIEIGNIGVAGDANTIRIGKGGTQNATFVAGIYGVTVTGSPVVVNSSGKLGIATSSARFKQAIKPMDRASEAILALKPVSFRYKEAIDPDGIPQFGLIAEEVEKVNPDLVGRDENGRVNTVRYEAVNAMLLNEFLKEHRKVEKQHATITRLESKVAKQELSATQQQKQIEALIATVQKVSDQVALSKPAPQLVANP